MKINILQKIRKNKSAPKVQRSLKTLNTLARQKKLTKKHKKIPNI